MEELVEVFKQRFVEQTIETPAFSIAEKAVEILVIQTQEKTRQVANKHVQHVVKHSRSGGSTLAVHRQGRRDPCCGAETDFHGPDCSEEYRGSTVAIL